MINNQATAPKNALLQDIETQLAEGRRLLELGFHNPTELHRASARRSLWVEKNVEIIRASPLSEKIKNKFLQPVGLDNTHTGGDFESEIDSFRDITKTQISILENVLALIPSPVERDRDVATPEAHPGAPFDGRARDAKPTLKERLESNPVGVAATLCVGCITVVVLVMTWVHGESEKGLTNKYEAQITGMRNDFEAQRRKYEETISKLNEELTKSKGSDNKSASP